MGGGGKVLDPHCGADAETSHMGFKGVGVRGGERGVLRAHWPVLSRVDERGGGVILASIS